MTTVAEINEAYQESLRENIERIKAEICQSQERIHAMELMLEYLKRM